MTNQTQLNQLFASKEDVNVKFFVPDPSEGTEALCEEALHIFDLHQKGQLSPSPLMDKSRGSVHAD